MKQGGRLAHSEDSYRKIGASESHIDIILPRTDVLLGRGLHLATPPSLLKPPMFSMLKSSGFSRKEPSVRWAQYRDSMLAHTLQFLTYGDLS